MVIKIKNMIKQLKMNLLDILATPPNTSVGGHGTLTLELNYNPGINVWTERGYRQSWGTAFEFLALLG